MTEVSECRWEQVILKGLAKGPWTREEDEIILRCKQQVRQWILHD